MSCSERHHIQVDWVTLISTFMKVSLRYPQIYKIEKGWEEAVRSKFIGGVMRVDISEAVDARFITEVFQSEAFSQF